MPIPHPDFRPNSQRAVNFFGPVGDELVDKLAPQIITLRGESEDAPITVLVNSNGGDPRGTDFVYSLLTTRNPSGKRPRVITVAVGTAASAAANMLALGDYAIAYPKADIHFHGIRYNTKPGTTITKELADLMSEQLKSKNQATAAVLARKGTERMAFHFARLKEECDKLGAENPQASPIECFAHLLRSELSHTGQLLVGKAARRWKELRSLSTEVVDKVRGAGKKGIDFESEVLKGVVDYEIGRHKGDGNWDLDAEGIVDVVSDYLLLREYDVGKHVGLITTILNRFPVAFFTDEEITKLGKIVGKITGKEIAAQADSDIGKLVMLKINTLVKPLCYFTTSIWQAMQEEENPLTPEDAYWLGAVDEVYGTKLPCLRIIAEDDNPEEPKLELSSSNETAPPVAQSPNVPSA